MKKEDFIRVIEKMKAKHKQNAQIYEIGVDVYEYAEDYCDCIHLLLKTIYNEDACDFIYWFICEKFEGKEILKAYDKDNNEIVKDVEGLHEYCEENLKK